MVVTLGQQYNIGEKPTVILYTYINRHAGTPEKQRRQNSTSSNMVVIIYCYIGCDDEVTTTLNENREDHDIDIFITESTRHRGKRKELASSLNTCQGYDTQMLLIQHRLSYGPALTRNTEERASIYQSDLVGLKTTYLV